MLSSALALFVHGAVADLTNKHLMRRANTGGAQKGFGSEDDAKYMHSAVDGHGTIQDPSLASFSHGAAADSLNKPLMRTAETGGAKMGIGSKDDAMHRHSAVDIHDAIQDPSPQQNLTAAVAEEDFVNRRTLLNFRNAIKEDTDDSTKEDTLLQALLEEDAEEEDEEGVNLQESCRRRGRRRRGCSDSTGRRRRGKSSS